MASAVFKPLSVCFAGRGKFDSYPLRPFREREVKDMSREEILKLTSLSSFAG